MTEQHPWLQLLGMIVVASPFLTMIILGVSSLLERNLSEQATTRLVYSTVVMGLSAALLIAALAVVVH